MKVESWLRKMEMFGGREIYRVRDAVVDLPLVVLSLRPRRVEGLARAAGVAEAGGKSKHPKYRQKDKRWANQQARRASRNRQVLYG